MLHCYRAERADLLIGALGEVLAIPPSDPLMPEVIAVHSRGIERWIAQELSHRLGTGRDGGDGVCANVAFPFPGRLVTGALALASGVEPDQDPWRPERLVWPLLEVLSDHLDDGWLTPLREHLAPSPAGDRPDHLRRFGAARHVADLFDRYAVHRPDMVRAWSREQFVNDAGDLLAPAEYWQARLWWELRGHVDRPSPPERFAGARSRLAELPASPELPGRLSLFGLTALPASYAEVLRALAANRELHLLLLHPSPVLWNRLHARPEPDTIARHAHRPLRHERPWPGAPPARAADGTGRAPRNPLLASWGRDARELQLVVEPVLDQPSEHLPLPAQPPADEPSSLLQRIQADVRADRRPGDPTLVDRDPADRSVQVHACHGRMRQVEVLRDALLHLLADDPTLEPRDIVVLCPEIEEFAPLVHAVFDRRTADGRDDDLPDLRVRLADRALRQTNPVLRVTAELLELADSRVTASQVIDLASRVPVRRRFRLDDEALDRLQAWVADAAIRWGLDGEHRQRFGLDGVTANTWRAGLDRLLLGVAMADEQLRSFGGVVPVDDVEGVEIDLAGRIAELVERLRAALTAFARTQDIASWRVTLTEAVESLTATPESERWQHLQLHRLLDDLVDEATVENVTSTTPFSLAELRSLLERRLAGRPSRANHRTGDLTVCTLVPMRAVPHRVVCLLGMDDGEFPRRTTPDGDDLTERQPRVGDRDRRSEDRQLLLDALLSASEHLLITFTGRDERTNEPRPPAVPVSELLDVIDRTVRDPGREHARPTHVLHHPLQTHDPANFRPGALLADRPFGFDRIAHEGAEQLAKGAGERGAFLTEPLPPVERTSVELADLVAFLRHPVKAFLDQRLQVTVGRRSDEPLDEIPVELEGLERWQLAEQLLALRREERDTRRFLEVTQARGLLPPGTLASAMLAELHEVVEALLEAAAEHVSLRHDCRPLEVGVTLPDGRLLTGAVPETCGETVLDLTYSRVQPKQRLANWAYLLAATAAHPQRAWQSVLVGRRRSGNSGNKVTCIRIGPLGATPSTRREQALTLLARLVEVHDRGLCEPLPLFCKTSAAWAEARLGAGADPSDAGRSAAEQWTSGWFPGEDRDAEHIQALGGVVEFERLLDAAPCPEEALWATGEPTRFGALAARLWEPLLAREQEAGS